MKTLAEKAAYQREWASKNPEKVRANRNSSYAKAHPEVQRKRTGHRRPNGALLTGSCRERNLWKRFGMTLLEYENLFQAQRGLCAICLCPERRMGKDAKPLPLSVDHDHETDAIRQLLCGDCNVALGLMKDDVLRLRAAVEYLIRHRERNLCQTQLLL
jgi:hypothetical protein